MHILIAREAPDFLAPAVMPNGVIEDNFRLSDLRMTPTAEGVTNFLSARADKL